MGVRSLLGGEKSLQLQMTDLAVDYLRGMTTPLQELSLGERATTVTHIAEQLARNEERLRPSG